jgi:hypothetical protein
MERFDFCQSPPEELVVNQNRCVVNPSDYFP